MKQENAPVIRAKITITNVNTNAEENDGNKTFEQVTASGVYSEDKNSENYSWSLATPSLSLNMHINNPKAFDKLESGKEYYLDFVPVEEN